MSTTTRIARFRGRSVTPSTVGQAPGLAVDLRGVVKRYGSVEAVADVDLSIAAGEFVTLLGASGSGKTSLLRLIAGFLKPDEGSVRFDGADMTRTPVERRNVGMVFQNYALFPHMSVNRNVAFPLAMKRVPRHERARLVREALDAVELGDLGRRRPSELSGGQQQRVALARAVVARPRLLLMDEPLGALDMQLRDALRLQIVRLSRDLGLTVVCVTHDQEEALSMSDRIALMADGHIVQVGSPQDLYQNPNSVRTARFIGESNLLRGRAVAAAHGFAMRCHDVEILLPTSVREVKADHATVLLVRPSRIALTRESSPLPDEESVRIPVTVLSRSFIGEAYRYCVALPDGHTLDVRADEAVGQWLAEGGRALASWDRDAATVVPSPNGAS